MKLKKIHRLTGIAVVASMLAGTAYAGPFILAGTDADDHGSATATANLDGWLFMQKALENLAVAPSLTNTNRNVLSLGSNTGTTAGNAAQSAFGKSSLVAAGWTFTQISDIAAASFDFGSALSTASIIMFDSGGNVGGGLTAAEQNVLTANAGAINSFVGLGGGLFSQSNSYGWLSSLVPGLTTVSSSSTGLALTSAGNGAFPGLTNANLSAGPWHNSFTGLGAIPVLATGIGSFSNSDVIIGAAGGSITNPDPDPMTPAIPEPSTYALMALGLAGIGWAVRRRKSV